LLLQAHAAVVLLLVAVLGHAPLLLQLQGALAFQHLAGGGIAAVVLGALALLVDAALLLLAGNAVVAFGAIARLGDPLRGQRLLAAPVLADPGVTLAVRGGLALLREALFAVLPFEALLVAVVGCRSRTLPRRRGALRSHSLFRGLLLAQGLLPGNLLALGDLTGLALAVLLLAGMRRPLLFGALPRGRGGALLGGFALASLRGACIGLCRGGMILPLRRLLGLARIRLLLLLLVVLLLVLVARILARVGRGIEAGRQQGAEHGGQQGSVADGVHGNPRVQPRGAGRKRLLARVALHVKST